MTTTRPVDLSVTVAGVELPFPAMNAAGAWSSSAADLRDLARSQTGAIVLRTVTVHPFVHPEYRSLHNPGYAKLAGLLPELAEVSRRPIIASIAGASMDEYVTLARAFADAGAALIEANVAEPYVQTTLAPMDEPGVLRELATRLVGASAAPIAVRLPETPTLPYRWLVDELGAARVPVVVAKNDFTGYEKLLLAARHTFQVIVLGGIRSGYDVGRALAKGAAAVQVRGTLLEEGPSVFGRLEREMRVARGERFV
jgi:dihydroorotate dehydrogenase